MGLVMHIDKTHSPETEEDVIGQDFIAKLGIKNRGGADSVTAGFRQVDFFGSDGLHGSSWTNPDTFCTMNTNALYTGLTFFDPYSLGRAGLYTKDTPIA